MWSYGSWKVGLGKNSKFRNESFFKHAENWLRCKVERLPNYYKIVKEQAVKTWKFHSWVSVAAYFTRKLNCHLKGHPYPNLANHQPKNQCGWVQNQSDIMSEVCFLVVLYIHEGVLFVPTEDTSAKRRKFHCKTDAVLTNVGSKELFGVWGLDTWSCLILS